MTRFRDRFRSEHTFLPAIHVKDEEQALRNARLAQEAGADGVFLVNHDYLKVPAARVVRIAELLRSKLPGFWIGLNCLDLNFDVVNRVPRITHGLWLDDQIVSLEDSDPTAEAERFQKMRMERGFKGLYFGCVAFKGQKPVDRPGEAARLAADFVDAITTSGPDTGHEPPVEQIMLMSAAAREKEKPLVVASGVSLGNVESYKPYVDGFIIASHISKSFWDFDPHLITRMGRALGK